MDVKVKICGIRSLESAQAAIDAGADFLGFNFVKSSKRFVYPIRAKTIIEKLEGKINIVGVFQNHSIDEVNTIADYISLDFIQLHGEEDIDYLSKIQTKIIKTIVIPTEVEGSITTEVKNNLNDSLNTGAKRFLDYARNDKISYLLLDRVVQGKGQMVDMQRAKEIAKNYPIFLAGGLNPENISQVIKEVRPFAVDVANGIETNGVEDPAKIQLFIYNCKERFATVPMKGEIV